MPSPFSKPQQTKAAIDETVPVVNSSLVCEVCFEETSEGRYSPQSKRLTFTCPNKHNNVVRNVEV